MKTFYQALGNTVVAAVTNTFVWFAVTFWMYLQTKSVLATSIMAGVYLGTVAISGFFVGSLVDRFHKRAVMVGSSLVSVACYALACAVYLVSPHATFTRPDSAALWALVVLSLFGAIAGNARTITLSTLVTLLVPEDRRDKANGLVGTFTGVAFLAASVLSGVVIGFAGIVAMFAFAIVASALAAIHARTLAIPETVVARSEGEEAKPENQSVDIRGTIRVVRLVPGLFGLIFFNCINNLLGGVFMSLMDAYGLSLVTVQVWGVLWGFLSLGFIVGGLAVAKLGLGKSPLRTLFLCNIVMWVVCVFFTMHASILLLTVGLFTFLCLAPVAEACEQTIMQKAIPLERQGRVFGFAQSVEQAASPVTAFVIGPIAELIFIPFMTTGAGVELIGSWFGHGSDRGLALLFTVTGFVGLCITLLARASRSYRVLSQAV